MKKTDPGVSGIGMPLVKADIIAAEKVLAELQTNSLKQLKSIAAYHTLRLLKK